MLAVGLWIVSALVCAALWFWTDQTFLARYQKRYGDYLSRSEQKDLLIRAPLGLLRRLPRETSLRIDARQRPVDDPQLETLRRRGSRLFLLTIAAGFGGLPIAFIGVGLARRIAGVASFPLIAHVVIAIGWAVLLVWVIRRKDPSTLAVAIALAGFATATLVTVVAVLGLAL